MKMGSNYAPTIHIQVTLYFFRVIFNCIVYRIVHLQRSAEKSGHQQVLWLFGEDHQLTEVGTMNIFIFMINKDGGILDIECIHFYDH